MADVATVARIAELAQHLRSGTPLSPDDAASLADALERYLDGADLRDALGLKPTPGERDPREAWRLEQRDELIRSAAAEHLAHLNHSARAREIHHALSAAWRVSAADEMPPHITGLKAAAWAILRIHRNIPTPRTIRAILAASPAFSLPTGDDDMEGL